MKINGLVILINKAALCKMSIHIDNLHGNVVLYSLLIEMNMKYTSIQVLEYLQERISRNESIPSIVSLSR
jgi:hypothetical protein